MISSIFAALLAVQSTVDPWAGVTAPDAPFLQPVTVEAETTALLVGDFEKQTCAPVPRCVASLPAEAKLLAAARESGAVVIYSVVPTTTLSDVLAAVAPNANDLYVQAGPDKFIKTDFDKLLRDHGVTTLVVTGTAAESTVLPTALHASQLGYNVVVPVDAMSSRVVYAEQYVAWDLTHAFGVRDKTKLTMAASLTWIR